MTKDDLAPEDRPKPPRLAAGPRAFECVNAPPPGAPPPAPIDVHTLNAIAHRPRGPIPSAHSAGATRERAHLDPNDIATLLRLNLDAAAPVEAQRFVPRKRRSRRRRDYWLVVILYNAAIAGVVTVVGSNLLTLVFAGAGAVAGSMALTWVMWVVMDDY